MKKLLAIAIVLLLFIPCSGCSSEMDYESAKKSAESFLISNQTELEEIAVQTLNDGKLSTSEFDGVSYISIDVSSNMVIFEVGAQGMLGGQYWSLIYAGDGTYCGETEQYAYYETNGNNVILAERLQGNWFFLWMDYDGREDLSNIK